MHRVFTAFYENNFKNDGILIDIKSYFQYNTSKFCFMGVDFSIIFHPL